MKFRDEKFVIDYPENLHHAYLIAGDAKVSNLLIETLTEAGVYVQGSQDAAVLKYETFGIDDAHELSRAQRRRSVSGGRKVFVITTEKLTVPAQNALLKVFEEPTADTHFFLITPRLQSIVPTLRSRTHQILVKTKITPDVHGTVQSFFSGSLPQRLAMVDKIAKADDSHSGARQFVSGLEDHLQSEFLSEEGIVGGEFSSFGEALISAHHYLEQNGVSIKVVLENLALQFPEKTQIK